jgi:hypothetical protein
MPLQRGHLRAKVIHDRLAVSEDGFKDLLLVLMRRQVQILLRERPKFWKIDVTAVSIDASLRRRGCLRDGRPAGQATGEQTARSSKLRQAAVGDQADARGEAALV